MLLLKLCLEVRKGAYIRQGNFHKMECMSALLSGILSVQDCRRLIIKELEWMDGGIAGWLAGWDGQQVDGHTRQVLSHACKGCI